MAEKLVTCNECQGMFDVGHIPPGREMKCPSCGSPLVVPGEDPQPIPVGSRPRTAVSGSSPRQATASGSRVGTTMKRSTPLMRRVTHSRGSGGTVVRGAHGEEQPLSNSRHGVAVQKKAFPTVLVVSIVGLVAVAIIVAMAMSSQSAAKQKAAEKGKKPGVTEAADPASGGATAKAGAPSSGGGRQVSVDGGASPATTPSGPVPKNLPAFQEGSDGSVDGWSVNAAQIVELEKKLLASWEKKGDPEIRKEILLKSDETFPLIADRLRSDKEGVAKEAAVIATQMFKKHDIKIGKEGTDFIPDLAMCNDPQKRSVLFREMREAWEKAGDRIKKDVTGGGAPSGDAGPVTSSSVVDALRRGGQDRDDMMAKMKNQPGYYVRELIKQFDAVGEDVLAGRAICRALNDLTSANIPVPTAGEFNAADQKKKWDEWLLGNLDKLK